MDEYNLQAIDWYAVVSWALIGGYAFLWLMQIISIVHAFGLHRSVEKCKDCAKPGISIGKPLCSSEDPNLYDNLTSYFELEYPEYELLFCVADDNDKDLIHMVQGLMTKYPKVEAHLFVGAQDVGPNPKVNNLVNAYEYARYPFFMISDDTVLAPPTMLHDMMHYMTERVALVHQLPYIVNGDLSFSRVVEKVFFGTMQTRVYLCANAVGVNCMTGMSIIVRKSVLDECGGLAEFGIYLGEDFFIAQAVINKGWKTQVASIPVQQNRGHSSLSAWQSRMVRWMYLRFHALPHHIFFEPMNQNIINGVFFSMAMLFLLEIPAYIFIPANLFLWMITDYLLLRLVEGGPVPFSFFSFMKAYIITETSFICIFAQAIAMKSVTWGGKSYRLKMGGKTELSMSEAPSSPSSKPLLVV